MIIGLFKKTESGERMVDRFDTIDEANEYVKEATEDEGSVFDYFIKEMKEEDIRGKVKSYEDACSVLGQKPMDEEAMKAVGFREDEIARRKLETIAEALNEGWKPDWNDLEQAKYRPWFYIEKDYYGASAGLTSAFTNNAPSTASTNLGSRLCYRTATLAKYAAQTFTHLYEEILVTNW